MASVARRLAANAPGDFYVDASCIDCEACMWIAPQTFAEEGDQSYVQEQPVSAKDEHRALMALVACPTASIGVVGDHDVIKARDAFPDPIAEGVYHLGYHAESSFGAASYLLTRPEGNVLIDSPRFAKPLVRNIEALGGVSLLFLTHRDDVADFRKFRSHFGCTVVIHERDAVDQDHQGTRLIRGVSAESLGADLLAIPVPGHTAGSTCLLYRDRFLFTGDHLAYSPSLKHPYAFLGACWYSWTEQITSMERLLAYEFEHIFPGHGRRCRYERAQMKDELLRCLAWMKRAPRGSGAPK